MAEAKARDAQFEYKTNSNLVLQADRTLIDRRDKNEATGEVMSLSTRVDTMRMGDKALRQRPSNLKERKERRARKEAKEEESFLKGAQGGGLLQDDTSLGQRYRPKTQQTQRTYELLLRFITDNIGSQPHDILCGAADEVLDTLKNDHLKAKERKVEIESLIGGLEEERFAQLVALGKRITDYTDTQQADDADDDGAIDENLGVAVIFDKDDDDESSDSGDDLDMVREADDVDGEEQGEEAAMDAEVSANLGDIEGEVDSDSIDPQKIDAFWLQRELSAFYDDANTSQKMAEDVLTTLKEAKDDRDCESKLVMLLTFERFDLIRKFRKNRLVILYGTLLHRATAEERAKLESTMEEDGALAAVLARLKGGDADGDGDDAKSRKKAKARAAAAKAADAADAAKGPRQLIKLADFEFSAGGHLMANSKCELPEGSTRKTHKGFEEVFIPAHEAVPLGADEKLVEISSLPEWAQPCFKDYESLNRVQSRLYPTTFGSDENILLCAPTGAGKTNVALSCIMHELGKHRLDDGGFNLDGFKVVYIAPMKSLVAEVTGNFRKRLEPYGMVVDELTGDHQLSKEQMAATQVIVCTPEKWDIITRKSQGGITSKVSLVIIDEIHLLHDGRGPVLESIVARTVRQLETTSDEVRLVGLSATLPNYEDVATFLKVDPSKGLFFFDGTFRPVPLEQTYIGITEKKAIKRLQMMNEIVYDKVIGQAKNNQQVIIFTHSRKDTVTTAKAIRDMCMERDTLALFTTAESATSEILRDASENPDIKDASLKDLLPYGFAVHHAGMPRFDRTMVEELFAASHVKVLVSTATLAWGVNLPAHAVIIKGTQIYSPEKGAWTELCALDVMQMIGRAGRPQYDKFGEGILITSHQELQYYLSLLNQQLPVESQYISRLPDNLNAEIVAGTVQNAQDAERWLGYTYLYIRMLRNPTLYGIKQSEYEEDPMLTQRRAALIHAAASVLDKSNMIKYDRKTGNFQVTDLGRIASHYYCSHDTMSRYNRLLKPTLSEIELIRVFAQSDEFKYINVRREEKPELLKMVERVPIPIKESIEEPTAKVNVLLQSYISQLRLDGFALVSDMVYVSQSAGRLLRAMYEVTLCRGWALLAEKTLALCKMVDKRVWMSMSPLRQFKTATGAMRLQDALIRKIEKKSDFSWEQLYDLQHTQLGELIRQPRHGKAIYKYIHQFPRLVLESNIQPITRTTIRVTLTITPDFQWDDSVHGKSEAFWIYVQDVDGEVILHHEFFLLKAQFWEDDHFVEFTVPITEPMPPQYFIKVVSDRWLGSETALAVSFRHLILPEKFPANTELLDLQPLPVSTLQDRTYEKLYLDSFDYFNAIQTQVFNALYTTDDNVFVGAPTGSGKTICGEFALLRAFSRNPNARCVYLAPNEDLAKIQYNDWRERFGKSLGKPVVELTGEATLDIKLLAKGQIIIGTPSQWDVLSRRWKQRKNVQNINLFMIDECHLIGGEDGPVLEVVASRMRSMASALKKNLRIVALSAPVANAKDLGSWLGISSSNLFNFHPNVRPLGLEIDIQGFNISHTRSRLAAMSRPLHNAIKSHARDAPTIVFVASRQQAQYTAIDLVSQVLADGRDGSYLRCSPDDIAEHLAKVKNTTLREMMQSGVVFLHAGLDPLDRKIADHLYMSGALQVAVVTRDLCWGLRLQSRLVVLMDTQWFDGREHRYLDYTTAEMLQMIGRANRPLIDKSSRCLIMCQSSKKEFLKKFLRFPLPVESHLDHVLHDHFSAETVVKTISSKQDAVDYMTWTFLYKRLAKNPNYYGLQGTTHRHLSEHLSEMVEDTLADLEQSKCIAIEEDIDVSPLNLGIIAAYYYINYTTIELFSRLLTAKTKIKHLLEILSASKEFATIPMRHKEDVVLRKLSKRLPIKLPKNARFNDPHTKAELLLQAHFQRLQLSAEFQDDLNVVLRGILRLIQAIVDVLSTSSWLSAALAAMELSQMVVQATWASDSYLKQIPHMTPDRLKRAAEKEVETVFDLTELEDADRDAILQMSPAELNDVAQFCNRYPNVELEYSVEDADDVHAGAPVTLSVTISRDDDDEEDGPPEPVGPVIAPFYPIRKQELWWLVVGLPESNGLLAIKKVPLQQSASPKLEFSAPETEGRQTLKLYLMCDSYQGCDQEFEFELDVKEKLDDDSDSEEESSEDEDGAMQTE
mmetsp:Transcript_3040/g.9258  ORF Transcript_3040/g.9258 Transcript_3040/m.9258 type:complete len:2169 (-) Transcript_3040:2467-8973(-)